LTYELSDLKSLKIFAVISIEDFEILNGTRKFSRVLFIVHHFPRDKLTTNMATAAAPTTTAQHMQQRHQQMQQQQQPQQPDPSLISAQAALNIEDTPPIRVVQVAALVAYLSRNELLILGCHENH